MKKYLLRLWLAVVTLLVAGCIETTEELTIGADGSGTYQVGMDMSGLFDMMEMLRAIDTTNALAGAEMKNGNMDTTLQLRHYADTASHLTPEQKALLQHAKMKMVMNEGARQFTMNMNFPFAHIEDVQKLMQISQSGSGGNMMGGLLKGSPAGGTEEQMPSINSYYDMEITGSHITRRLNKEKYSTLQQQNMEQAGDMLEGFKTNTVIHLPRPAKKVEGSRAQLSADKKTLTLNASLMDLYQNPEALSYRVEF